MKELSEKKVEKIINIDKNGKLTIPSKDFSHYISVDFNKFLSTLSENDSIYYDDKEDKYNIIIDNIKYTINISNDLKEDITIDYSTKNEMKVKERLLDNKRKKVERIVKENREYPVTDEEIDLYDEILNDKYKKTKAVARKETKNVLGNVLLATAASAGALCSAAYISDKSLSSLVILISISALLGASINSFEKIAHLDRVLLRKDRLKRQVREFDDYLEDIAIEEKKSRSKR